MKEHGITFTPDNYARTEAEAKTQTRRIINPQPPFLCEYVINGNQSHALCRAIADHNLFVPPTHKSKDHRLACPFGTVGDRLYVKEGLAWDGSNIIYRLDKQPVIKPFMGGAYGWLWLRDTLSPIHMPRWAARLWLELTGVRVERINEISYDDEGAEGVTLGTDCNDRHSGFIQLWESVNGTGSWNKNDWVWVLDFRKVDHEI